MAWSTRELAEISGTSVSAIRHYHQLGLLNPPERKSNGYKQYRVEHLVAVLRIRRYADLGVPLSQIGRASSDETGAETEKTLRTLDLELAAGIERMVRARADIATILSGRESVSVPTGFADSASRLSDADRSMVHVFARLFDGQALKDLQTIVDADNDEAGAEFDTLPADSEDATRSRLAERLAPAVARYLREHPWLADPAAHLSEQARLPASVLSDALADLYNPAQLDVLVRARALADTYVSAEPSES